MRIARFTADGRTRLGVVEEDRIADVGSAAPALPTDLGELLAGPGIEALHGPLAGARRLPLDLVTLEAPIARPPEFLAIGLNYALHVAESGKERPERPVVFNKQATCVNGPFAPIEMPTVAPDMVDYEGELGIVIGRACRGVPPEHALDVVAGYLVVNDVSVRDWQKATPTMTMGKSWDTHGPIGPWMVTADEIPDPQAVRIRTWVDDELRQDESTSQMLTDCRHLIAHLSTAFTLLPGTIIATGTPAGVGMGMTPPGFVKPGQTVRIEIDAIGTIENRIIAQPTDSAFW